MAILCRHRRQLRDLGVRPVSSRHRRRRRPPPTTNGEAASFVDSGRGSVHPPPSGSPEVSRRGAQRPRPSRRPPSPLELVQPASPTSPQPGQVHLPPRDSPVFVHVESPRESPLLGRVPPAPAATARDELLLGDVEVSPPPDSVAREQSPIWVRLQEALATDGTLAVPEEPPRVTESPVWVHFAFEDSPSTTVSTSTPPAAVPVTSPGQHEPPRPGRDEPQLVAAPNGETATLSRSYSNPYRQDTYRRTGERRAVTPQRGPRQRRLLRFD